jgi:CHAT domain-containing protein
VTFLLKGAQTGASSLEDGMSRLVQGVLTSLKPRQRVFHSAVSLSLSVLLLSGCLTPLARAGASAQEGAGSSLQSQSEKDAQTLELGKPIERELKGGEVHYYKITLASGQYLRVVVEQRGVDVVVTLFGPDGKKIVEVDSPNGTQGPEPLSFVADTPGEYRVEVRSLEKDAAPGYYEAKIEELREAKTEDKTRIAAEKTFAEGELLRVQGTAESLQRAIKKYEEALGLWRSLKDRAGQAGTLNSLGVVYASIGENKKSLTCFEESLPLFQEVEDGLAEGDVLYNIGAVNFTLGDTKKSLDFLNRSLQRRRVLGNKAGEAQSLGKIGSIYSSLGEQQLALRYLEQALRYFRELSDRNGEAETLNNVGLVYNGLGENPRALQSLDDALRLFRAIGNRAGEATALNNMGKVHSDLGESQKVLEYYNQALPISRETGDRQGEATTLNNIGQTYSDLGEKQKALDYFGKVLSILRELGYRMGEARTLNNIGVVYNELGDRHKALDFHGQALLLARAIGDRGTEATMLINIGLIYSQIGEIHKALDYLTQALPISRALGDRRMEAVTLSNIGSAYAHVSELVKALDFYKQALSLDRTAGNRRGEAVTLNNIGQVFTDLGERQKAIDHFGQSLLIHRAVENRSGEATTLNNMAIVYGLQGEKQKALDTLNQALLIHRNVEDPQGEAAALANIGEFYALWGEKQSAFDYLSRALPIRQAVGDRIGEARTLYEMSKVVGEQGNLTRAREYVETAINIIESLRTKIASPEWRASYFASVQSHYRFYVDLLIRLHKSNPSEKHDAAALQASERARARSLLEMLAEARVDIREGVDAALLERERTLQQQLNSKADYQIRLLSGKRTEEQAAAVKKELETLRTEFQEVQAQIRAKSPRYAALTQPQPLSLKEIQEQVLDNDSLLLEYSLGEERSYLWAVTPTGMTSYDLPKRAEIEAAARRVYDLLTARNRREKFEAADEKRARVAKADAEYWEAASALSQMILGPVAEQLGKKRLLIVADGALQYVSFAALPAPWVSGLGTRGSESSKGESLAPNPEPLITNHEIVSLPSASVLAVLRGELAGRKPAPKTVAVLADPVFHKDDERLKKLVANRKTEVAKVEKKTDEQPRTTTGDEIRSLQFERSVRQVGMSEGELRIPRLPFTRQEAEGIVALARTGDGMKALDFQASRPTATSDQLSQYRIVHFATHGVLNSEQPELSGIVLSLVDENGKPQDGFLRAHEVYNLKLPAELVVLSGCKTGLGKEIKGEGLVGLTRGFMYAGAARVMVSLWDVSDVATSELMKRFYKAMLKDGERPAAALRAAQVSMLKEKRWQSPYFWAAFILQGEWK